MIRRPPRSTRTDTLFPYRRSSDLPAAFCDLREATGWGLRPLRGSGGDDVAMTKSELIQHIADLNPQLYHRDVERIVTTIFDEISEALAKGDRVELRGFRSEERRVGKEWVSTCRFRGAS